MGSSSRFDAVVVGGGIVGCVAFFELAKVFGRRVLLVEAGTVGGHGATRDTGAMVRAFDPDPVILDLAQRSLPDYQDLMRAVGSPVPFHSRRLVYATAASLPVTRALVERHGAEAYPLEVCSGEDPAGLVRFAPGTTVVVDGHAGFLEPLATCAAYVRAGVARGGRSIERTKVRALRARNGRCEAVETDAGIYHADVVVLACGAEGTSLLQRSVETFGLRTKLIRYVIADAEWTDSKEPAPALPMLVDEIHGVFLKAISASRYLLGKVVDRWDLDPRALPAFAPDEVEAVLAHFAARLRGVSRLTLVTTVSGVDLYTPTRVGTLDFSEVLRNCLVVTGQSGHGFKVAPEVGRRVRERIVDR